MSSQDQASQHKGVRQKEDDARKNAEQEEKPVSNAWQLTKQQKAFIDLFSEDDSKPK